MFLLPAFCPYLFFILVGVAAFILDLHEDFLQLLLGATDEFVGGCSFPVKMKMINTLVFPILEMSIFFKSFSVEDGIC